MSFHITPPYVICNRPLTCWQEVSLTGRHPVRKLLSREMHLDSWQKLTVLQTLCLPPLKYSTLIKITLLSFLHETIFKLTKVRMPLPSENASLMPKCFPNAKEFLTIKRAAFHIPNNTFLESSKLLGPSQRNQLVSYIFALF